MDAEAEGSVAILRAIDNDLVRLREHGRIAVGCGKRKQDHVSRLQRTAANLRLLDDLACHCHRRVGAQELFDCRTHKARVGREPAAVLRLLRQMPQQEPIVLHVVSIPAIIRSRSVPLMWSSENAWSSMRAVIRYPIRSSRGLPRCAAIFSAKYAIISRWARISTSTSSNNTLRPLRRTISISTSWPNEGDLERLGLSLGNRRRLTVRQ